MSEDPQSGIREHVLVKGKAAADIQRTKTHMSSAKLKVLTIAAVVTLAASARASAQAYAYEVATIAGSTNYGSADGEGSKACFNEPLGLCLDAAGRVYVADTFNSTIRQLTLIGTNWVTKTIAGTPGNPGLGEGTNGAIRFNFPYGVAVDREGNIFVADTHNSVIRELKPMGIDWVSSTIAGVALVPGASDGTNSQALFNNPCGLASDPVGNLYVADTGNNAIRKLCHSGSNWVTTTLLINSNNPSQFSGPWGIAMDSMANLFVADTHNNLVRMLTQTGTTWVLNTIAVFNFPSAVAVDRSGTVYVAATFDGAICKLVLVGTNWVSCTLADSLYAPSGVGLDASGYLYTVENNRIRKLTPGGTNWVLNTIAGLAGQAGSADGTNAAARFNVPTGLCVDDTGNVFVVDTRNAVIRQIAYLGTNWVTSTIAGLAGETGSADGIGHDSRFNQPMGIAVGPTGNVYIADTFNSIIRELSPVGGSWISSTIAGLAGANGSTDGTNNNARFNWPMGIAVDRANDLYVADTANNLVRELIHAGTNWVTRTIAGLAASPGSNDGANSAIRFYGPAALAVDDAGVLYVADTSNSTVRELTPAGTNWVSRTIGGLAGYIGTTDATNTDARFQKPRGIAVSGYGDVYVSDAGNNLIRRLVRAGTNWISSTIAGRIEWPYSSTDGPNSDPRFNVPIGIAVDRATNLFVADAYTSTIREAIPNYPVLLSPVFQSVVERNGLITLTWSTIPGQTYQLQFSADLISANWNNLGTFQVATEPALSFIDSIGTERQRFYRVVLLP